MALKPPKVETGILGFEYFAARIAGNWPSSPRLYLGPATLVGTSSTAIVYHTRYYLESTLPGLLKILHFAPSPSKQWRVSRKVQKPAFKIS